MNLTDCINRLSSEFDVIDIIDCDNFGNQWIDLYIKLKSLYKPAYEVNERIIIKITYDYYKTNESYGKILQSVQQIINDIDISNFFICIITTNNNIKSEYNTIFETYNIDSIPFHLYTCKGDFNKKDGTDIIPFSKIASVSSTAEVIDQLDEHEKYLLFRSKTFCIAPWTSMMISTDDTVQPCCEFKGDIGNSKKSSLEEIWNDSAYRNIRKRMLNNRPVEGCKSCYLKEKYGRDTLRNSLNRRFAKHISKINQTSVDGHLDSFELVYLDSRFNNLCNLSCRSCGHSSSSSWHKPAVQLGLIASDTPIFLTAGRSKSDLIDQIKMHVDTIESIYFAGGEPLIMEDFYYLVEELDKQGRHDVKLIYNTNLTKFKIKDKTVFDLWKNFEHIAIGASLDAEGARGEYLRCGTKWQDVVEFRKELIKHRPDIDFYVSATTSIINALHVPDFHKSWVDQKLIQPEQFNIQLLFHPAYMRVDSAPVLLREKIIKKYTQHLNWLRPLDNLGRATFGFESVINQLDNVTQFDRKMFWDNVTSLDNYYKTELLEVFPELVDLK